MHEDKVNQNGSPGEAGESTDA